ncbi:MAG: hypothetical protein IIX18_00680 [Clostridia bacterium]|nr:hypothetical protein [Clostridia bacterium]
MSNKFFPGANTGLGFFSRFSGILGENAEKHYTYVLKGGPGVGKNTLMHKVMENAKSKGYNVEEFRCASDPKSLDAIRIVEMNTVLLDGTAPHSIDPAVPGIYDEIVDLGHFKNKGEFAKRHEEVMALTAENKNHYKRAYSLLGAARLMKTEALSMAESAVNRQKLYDFLLPFTKNATAGGFRELFLSSATPSGIVKFTDSFSAEKTEFFSGILGEVALNEAKKMLAGRHALVGYDFVVPDMPLAINMGETALAVGEGENLLGLCDSPLPPSLTVFLSECERLSALATAELSHCLETHDKIEDIYREYVDYDRVNLEYENLQKELSL